MVNSFAAYGCSNRFVKSGTRSFHKFPLNVPEWCKKWTVALKCEHFILTKHSCICSNNFLPSDYNFCVPDKNVAAFNHKLFLKSDVVPSIFLFSSKEKKQRKPPTKRKSTKSKPPAKRKLISPNLRSLCSRIMIDNNSSNVSSIDNVSKNVSPIKESLRKKIKVLQQKLRKEKIIL